MQRGSYKNQPEDRSSFFTHNHLPFMPGILKQVRFSRTKTLFPTPTYSDSDSSSLSSPYSPRPTRSNSLTYGAYHDSRRQPQRRATHTSYTHTPRVHPILTPAYSTNYDLRYPPKSHSYLSEPATSPPVSSLTLASPYISTVQVRPSHGYYVTVGDVLSSLYHFLRTNATQSTFDRLGWKDRRRVTKAYEDRWKRATDRAREKSGGVKRVDFLAGHTVLRGLSEGGAGVYVVHVSSS